MNQNFVEESPLISYRATSRSGGSKYAAERDKITEMLRVLQTQRTEFMKDQVKLHRSQVKSKLEENLNWRKIQTYKPTMALRKPFLHKAKVESTYFERNKDLFFPNNPNFKDIDITYFMLPDKFKDPKGLHAGLGNQSSKFDLFGKPSLDSMGRDEKRRYLIWEEIKNQQDKEQEEIVFQTTDGKCRKASIDTDRSKIKIFKPIDSKLTHFTLNPSSLYDVPRTPGSTNRLVSLQRNVEHNINAIKWNPNNSTEGIFDKNVYSQVGNSFHQSPPV